MFYLIALFSIPLSYFFLDRELALIIDKNIHFLYIYKLLSFIIAPYTHLFLSCFFSTLTLKKKFNRYQNASFTYCATILISMLICGVLKIILGRARPELFLETCFYGFSFFEGFQNYFRSFPSGHTATAFGLVYLFRGKWYLYLTTTLFISSRLLLNDHFLSDLIGGAIIGVLSAKTALLSIKKIEQALNLLDLNVKKL
jgi:membrane-associated phospholipid phosphatase